MKVARTLLELARDLGQLKTKSIGFVPTMGALHEGHASLLKIAKSENEAAVLSIYVNPTQFAPGEDLSRYPRTLENDLEVARTAGIDLVFFPSDAEIYPPGYSTYIEVEGVSAPLCGQFRPGHFRGVATVVHRLFQLVGPARAYFGLKDLQQCLVLDRMVRDLNLGVEMRFLPTVREPDGLALSSRNRYLSPEDRARAPRIRAALNLVSDAFVAGEREASRLAQLGVEYLSQERYFQVQYFEVLSLPDLGRVPRLADAGAVAVAAFLGTTRLIDNQILGKSRFGS